MLKHIVLLAFFCAQSPAFYAQSDNSLDKEAITTFLHAYINDDAPGMAVGIVKDGEIIYEHYLGYANLNHDVKVDQNTRFNIASNAKQFTALGILKLIEEGKIDIDDDFRKYLPGLYENIQDEITISNLLTHTSGVRDYCDLMALQGKTWWKQFIDNDDVMELMEEQRDLNFQAGSVYLYSNTNYILLTEIIKKVTGQDFDEYAMAMFEEMGMDNTHFLSNYMTVLPNKARPYGNWNGWREIPVITDVHGDGALFTTLRDQLLWESEIQRNDGSDQSQQFIYESQSPLSSSIDMAYGYGLEFDTYGGLNRTFHNGATGGYRATFWRFPSEKVSVTIMTNNREVPIDYMTSQIVSAVLKLEAEKEDVVYLDHPDKIEKLQDINDVLGVYKGVDGTVIRITEKDNSIYREMYRRDPIKLIHENEGLFSYDTNQDLKINFENIGLDNQQFTLYKSTQKPSSFIKVSDLDMSEFDKNLLNGRFYNEETDTEIVIKYKEGNNYSLTKNGRERNAELIISDYLRMLDVYKIKFIRDEQNTIIGLNIDRDRIKNVIFQKL